MCARFETFLKHCDSWDLYRLMTIKFTDFRKFGYSAKNTNLLGTDNLNVKRAYVDLSFYYDENPPIYFRK